ncbi:hypothetical protein SAMN05216345_109130 [Cupriavidus sp. YR651]|uniref:hypothetical protein n=1 Tax=Cupriavidus sp. YR651 TaxID=1855315 RepID=UPI000890D6F0|nr:hypothetical protein [Cupriavidus sp. YR651]SDD46278.1 hypothetical protein SAMN05216345_109130 [Cupriavidus sp. YR651]
MQDSGSRCAQFLAYIIIVKSFLFIGLCLSSASALAASQVVLETPVTYAAGAGVVEQVKTECHIEDILANRVGEVLRKRNKGGAATIEADANPNGAQVLRLKITHVLGIGGGAWTGPKAITVVAELLEDGKITRQTKVNRWSVGGFWGAFKGTCSILDRSAIFISKDMARWIKDPSYVVKDEGPPKEATASEPPASESPASEPAAEPADATAE